MFKKSRQLFIFLSGLQLSASYIQANYDLDDLKAADYRAHYNTLPSVEKNNQKLEEKREQFARFLQKAEDVVVKHGMEDYVGLRLIHSHFLVDDNQIMVEEKQTVQNIPSLVTQADTIDQAKQKQAVPASWIFSKDQSQRIFETSTDEAVRDGLQIIKSKSDFVSDMRELLTSNDFDALLALALLKRDSLVAHDGQLYVELNSDSSRQSVVQVWDTDKQPENVIRTSWSFKGPKQQGCLSSSVCIPAYLTHFKEQLHSNISF